MIKENSDLYYDIKFSMYKRFFSTVAEFDAKRISNIMSCSENDCKEVLEHFHQTVIDGAGKLIELTDIPVSKEHHRIVFIGDSITSDRESYLNIIREVYKYDDKLVFIDAAVSGDKTDDVIKRFYLSIMNKKPDIAHILIGTNDMIRNNDEFGKTVVSIDECRKNIEYIVSMLKHNGIKILLSTISPTFNKGFMTRFPFDNWIFNDNDIQTYNNMLTEVASEFAIQLNDMRCIYNRYDVKELLRIDGLHLNKFGQLLLAKNVLEGLSRFM